LPPILIESLENQSFLRFFRAAESRFMPWEAHMPAPHGFGMKCPLWVISGHVGPHEKASALRLKADILRGG
jgi:hypothetical protein